MTDPDRWDAAEKEQRLLGLFEEIQTIEYEVEFMEIVFGDDTPVYQYTPDCHNVTGLDAERVAGMTAILERHDLAVVDTGDSRGVIETVVSRLTRAFSDEGLPPETEWIMACHGGDVAGKSAYTVFRDICRSVYGSDTSAVTEATIKCAGNSDISWTDV